MFVEHTQDLCCASGLNSAAVWIDLEIHHALRETIDESAKEWLSTSPWQYSIYKQNWPSHFLYISASIFLQPTTNRFLVCFLNTFIQFLWYSPGPFHILNEIPNTNERNHEFPPNFHKFIDSLIIKFYSMKWVILSWK